jgi:hypothetical protein
METLPPPPDSFVTTNCPVVGDAETRFGGVTTTVLLGPGVALICTAGT